MNIADLVREANEARTSDIHLIYGLPPKCRVDGGLRNLREEPLTDQLCDDLARQMCADRFDEFLRVGELDLARSYDGVRVRINLFRQQEHTSASVRLLSNSIPKLDGLGLPPRRGGLDQSPKRDYSGDGRNRLR